MESPSGSETLDICIVNTQEVLSMLAAAANKLSEEQPHRKASFSIIAKMIVMAHDHLASAHQMLGEMKK